MNNAGNNGAITLQSDNYYPETVRGCSGNRGAGSFLTMAPVVRSEGIRN